MTRGHGQGGERSGAESCCWKDLSVLSLCFSNYNLLTPESRTVWGSVKREAPARAWTPSQSSCRQLYRGFSGTCSQCRCSGRQSLSLLCWAWTPALLIHPVDSSNGNSDPKISDPQVWNSLIEADNAEVKGMGSRVCQTSNLWPQNTHESLLFNLSGAQFPPL